jgi:hypothetical protein
MGVSISEVGYTAAVHRREDHVVQCGDIGEIKLQFKQKNGHNCVRFTVI